MLSGGSAFYAPTVYQSRDLDFIIHFVASESSRKEAGEALRRLGYVERGGTYEHGDSPYTIDFPPGPLAVGQDIITSFDSHQKQSMTLHIISPTDSVRDRLAAYYHWNDRSALAAAIGVAKAHRIKLENVRS